MIDLTARGVEVLVSLPFPKKITPTSSVRGELMFWRKKKDLYLVSQALDDYADDFALRGCKSMRSLRSEIAALKRRFDGVAVSDLTVPRLREMQSAIRADGFAAATVNKLLAILSAALNLAVASERIPSVPKFPKRLRCSAPRQGFLEHADYLAIREELPPWGWPIIDFGYYSGWRKNEVLTLSRDEVDLEASG